MVYPGSNKSLTCVSLYARGWLPPKSTRKSVGDALEMPWKPLQWKGRYQWQGKDTYNTWT